MTLNELAERMTALLAEANASGVGGDPQNPGHVLRCLLIEEFKAHEQQHGRLPARIVLPLVLRDLLVGYSVSAPPGYKFLGVPVTSGERFELHPATISADAPS